MFVEKGVLKICSKFTEEHPCRSVISIKSQSLFIEITIRHGFPLDDDDEIVFVVWLTNERRLALFSVGAIVRDPHHHESPTRREQDLNLY